MCLRPAPRKDPRVADKRTAGKSVAARPDQRDDCGEGDGPGEDEVEGEGPGDEVEGDECPEKIAVVSEPRLAQQQSRRRQSCLPCGFLHNVPCYPMLAPAEVALIP